MAQIEFEKAGLGAVHWKGTIPDSLGTSITTLCGTLLPTDHPTTSLIALENPSGFPSDPIGPTYASRKGLQPRRSNSVSKKKSETYYYSTNVAEKSTLAGKESLKIKNEGTSNTCKHLYTSQSELNGWLRRFPNSAIFPFPSVQFVDRRREEERQAPSPSIGRTRFTHHPYIIECSFDHSGLRMKPGRIGPVCPPVQAGSETGETVQVRQDCRTVFGGRAAIPTPKMIT